MKPEVQPRALARRAKSFLAGLMVLILVLTSLLAVSPAHNESHHLHHGAANQDCALCLFSHGQLDVADPAPRLAARELVPADLFVPHLVSFISALDYQLLPGRAPPSFS